MRSTFKHSTHTRPVRSNQSEDKRSSTDWRPFPPKHWRCSDQPLELKKNTETSDFKLKSTVLKWFRLNYRNTDNTHSISHDALRFCGSFHNLRLWKLLNQSRKSWIHLPQCFRLVSQFKYLEILKSNAKWRYEVLFYEKLIKTSKYQSVGMKTCFSLN